MCGSRIDAISTDFTRAALEQAGRWLNPGGFETGDVLRIFAGLHRG
jgi:hypothetical protein